MEIVIELRTLVKLKTKSDFKHNKISLIVTCPGNMPNPFGQFAGQPNAATLQQLHAGQQFLPMQLAGQAGAMHKMFIRKKPLIRRASFVVNGKQ